jgi:hypothetical protein
LAKWPRNFWSTSEDAIHSEKRGGSCETCHCRERKVSSVVDLLSSFDREYTGSAILVMKK